MIIAPVNSRGLMQRWAYSTPKIHLSGDQFIVANWAQTSIDLLLSKFR